MKTRRRWVVKAGSNMVCSGGPLLLRAWMQQVARLRRDLGIEVIWVTSGAIASAVDRTGFRKRDRELSEKQALSAIGQPLVMDLYNISLQAVGLLGAQVLLTYDDLSHARRRSNFQVTMNRLLSWDVTPILNENDAMATEEIRFGDNDSLSAKVARVMQADRLVILTDVDGLYERNPKEDPRARRVEHLQSITPKVLAQAGKGAGSSRGTGGMYSKLLAAREATRAGIETWLAQGDSPSVLLHVAANDPVGTRIDAVRPHKRKQK
jgi:glutamate 5-kinase